MKFPRFAHHTTLLALILIGVITTLAVAYNRFFPESKPTRYPIYFSLSALNSNGQPIAGAAVYLQNDFAGLTDSFGQWKKLHPLVVDRLVHIRLEKATSTTPPLIAIKNLVVAPEELSSGNYKINTLLKLAPKP